MSKIKIEEADFIKLKMGAVKAYIKVAKSCQPAALHAAMLTMFDVQGAKEPHWKPVDIGEFKTLLAEAQDDDDFREKLSKL